MLLVKYVLMLIGMVLFINFSYAEKTIRDDLQSIINSYFLELEGHKFNQKDIDSLFNNINHGVIRFQIINNKIYYIDKKIISALQRVDHKHLAVLTNILTEMLKRYKVKNVDFIISIYDDGEHLKFIDELKNPYVPILVFAKDKSNDSFPIKIPFIDYFTFRWQKFSKEVISARLLLENQWKNKKNKIFWRGISTGKNYNVRNYLYKPRIRLITLSKNNPEIIDAKLTNIIQTDPILASKILSISEISSYTNISDQLKYKYLIDIDGHTSSFSPWRLLSGSVTFKQETNNIQWFYPLLKPWIHYVPIKEDLSDIFEKFEYALSNDGEMKQISYNAMVFASNYLSMDNTYAYAAMVLNTYAEHQDFTLKSPSFWTLKTDQYQLISAVRDFMYNIWSGILINFMPSVSWRFCCVAPPDE